MSVTEPLVAPSFSANPVRGQRHRFPRKIILSPPTTPAAIAVRLSCRFGREGCCSAYDPHFLFLAWYHHEREW